MNKEQLLEKLKYQGFSEKIIDAFKNIQRENFIPEEFRKYAYQDIAVSIGKEQTISQPYTIAFMLSLLELNSLENSSSVKIMEVGSGSGYVLALLNQIFPQAEIYGIERIPELIKSSKKTLENISKIKIVKSGKEFGMKNKVFDRILVSASADKLPEILIEQLKDNGILVIPVKESIVKIKKINGKIEQKDFPGFVFVPLIKE